MHVQVRSLCVKNSSSISKSYSHSLWRHSLTRKKKTPSKRTDTSRLIPVKAFHYCSLPLMCSLAAHRTDPPSFLHFLLPYTEQHITMLQRKRNHSNDSTEISLKFAKWNNGLRRFWQALEILCIRNRTAPCRRERKRDKWEKKPSSWFLLTFFCSFISHAWTLW